MRTVFKAIGKQMDPVYVVFEYHANGGPLDVFAKVAEFSGQYRSHLVELSQIATHCHHHSYPSGLFLAKYTPDAETHCVITFHRSQLVTDEMVLPARLAYDTVEGHNLRTGRLPGVSSTSSGNNEYLKRSLARSKGDVS